MTKPATAEEVYDRIVKALPPSQRLKLATMILNDIPPQSVVEYDETWSETDIQEFSAASWKHVLRQVAEEEADARSG